MFSKEKRLGKRGKILNLSKDILTSKSFSIDGDSYKYYFVEPIMQGFCGYYNKILDKTLMLSYDKGKLPYLGIWINDGSFKGMYNIALEPCTVAYDKVDEAHKRKQKSVIKANDILEFIIDIDLYEGIFNK